MGMTVERFRRDSQRRRAGRKRGATPYSAQQRAFAVSFAQSERAKGRSVAQASAALGVSEPALREWLRQSASTSGQKADSASAPSLVQSGLVRSVVVKPSGPTEGGTLTLITPSGYRLNGLDFASAAALLRALS